MLLPSRLVFPRVRRRRRRLAAIGLGSALLLTVLGGAILRDLHHEESAWLARAARAQTSAHRHTSALRLGVLASRNALLSPAAADALPSLARAAAASRLQFRVASASGGALDVAFHPDGSIIAVAGRDGVVRLHAASSGAPIGQLAGHTDAVNAVAFGPGGAMAMTGSDDGTARIWNVESRATLHEMWTYEPVVDVSLGEELVYAATATPSTVAVWDVEHGRRLRQMDVDREAQALSMVADGGLEVVFGGYTPSAVRFTHEDTTAPSVQVDWPRNPAVHGTVANRFMWIAFGEATGVIRVENILGGARLGTLAGHTSAVTDSVFDPTDLRLLSASEDGTARLWDVRQSLTFAVLGDHVGAVRAVAFGPHGHRAATVDDQGTLAVWDVRTPSVDRVDDRVLLQGTPEMLPLPVPSLDGSRVVERRADGQVQVVDTATGVVVLELRTRTPVVGAAFDADGGSLWFVEEDDSVRRWELGWAMSPQDRRRAGLAPLLEAVCAPVGGALTGSDRILTVEDVEAAPGLRGQVGRDVCAGL